MRPDEQESNNRNEGKAGYVLRRNKFGNYEHPATRFVFDKDTKCVFGRQNGNEVVPLSPQEIEICKTLNFKVQ